MDCCTIFCAIIGIIIVVVAAKDSADKSAKEQEREYRRMEAAEQAHRNTISSLNSQWDSQWNLLHTQEKQAVEKIKRFFDDVEGSYSYTHEELLKILANAQDAIAELRKTNASRMGVDQFYSDRKEKIDEKETLIISRLAKLSKAFDDFSKKVMAYSRCRVMTDLKYGQCDKVFLESVRKMDRAEVYVILDSCSAALKPADLDSVCKIWEIEIDELIKCIWFFALEKNFSAHEFRNASTLFRMIYKQPHADPIIADLYAKKQVGGEDALRDHVNELLRSKITAYDSNLLAHIASALMWMNAYQSENAVLQHMLGKGMTMSPKMQERLHALTNGGGKAPSSFDVTSRKDELYFDVSALAWRDEEYAGLFENLAFQDKKLTYSLAVREENKDIVISQGLKMPTAGAILEKMNAVFDDEYGSEAIAKEVQCIALSGSGEEKLDGILAVPKECPQMGVLIHVAKIGKRLIIKFYTIFIPSGSDVASQKQKALSLYKKLSPSVTIWESSLKDTMLLAVERVLNASAQISGHPGAGNGPDLDEPLF